MDDMDDCPDCASKNVSSWFGGSRFFDGRITGVLFCPDTLRSWLGPGVKSRELRFRGKVRRRGLFACERAIADFGRSTDFDLLRLRNNRRRADPDPSSGSSPSSSSSSSQRYGSYDASPASSSRPAPNQAENADFLFFCGALEVRTIVITAIEDPLEGRNEHQQNNAFIGMHENSNDFARYD